MFKVCVLTQKFFDACALLTGDSVVLKILHQFRLCIKTYNFRPFFDLRLALYAELHYKSNHPSTYLLTFVMLKIPPWYYFISSKGLKSLTCRKYNCCMRWPKVINCELFIFTMPCNFRISMHTWNTVTIAWNRKVSVRRRNHKHATTDKNELL